MILTIISTGSSGNCYLLQNDNYALCIEAGMPFKFVKRALNFNIKKLVGVLVTHAHLDHSGYVKQFAEAGINVYSSLECLTATGLINSHHHRAKPIVSGRQFKIGEFSVLPFLLVHDILNLGYLINNKETGLFSILTDTHYSPFIFPGLNNLLLECNYSDNVIEERVISGRLNPHLAERIKGSHMAESTMLEFLKANDTTHVNNIVIIHLSKGNADAQQIIRNVTETAGIVPTIAVPGLSINFDKTAF